MPTKGKVTPQRRIAHDALIASGGEMRKLVKHLTNAQDALRDPEGKTAAQLKQDRAAARSLTWALKATNRMIQHNLRAIRALLKSLDEGGS